MRRRGGGGLRRVGRRFSLGRRGRGSRRRTRRIGRKVRFSFLFFFLLSIPSTGSQAYSLFVQSSTKRTRQRRSALLRLLPLSLLNRHLRPSSLNLLPLPPLPRLPLPLSRRHRDRVEFVPYIYSLRSSNTLPTTSSIERTPLFSFCRNSRCSRGRKKDVRLI